MSGIELSEKVRVLHAALRRARFTAAELAELAGVSTETVRTVLMRSKDLIEEDGLVPSGKRGGQPKSYRLKERARETLAAQLIKLTRALNPSSEVADTQAPVRAALTAAESSIHFAQEATAATDKSEWLGRARLQLDAARRLLSGIHGSEDRAAQEAVLKKLASTATARSPREGLRWQWMAPKPVPVPIFGSLLTDEPEALASECTALPAELSPTLLPSGEGLTPTAAAIGVANLEFFVRCADQRSLTGAYLIGVNRGGYLLASLLASRLSIESDRLVGCDSTLLFGPRLSRPLVDAHTVVIIDDVVRTGRTLSAVKALVHTQCPGALVQTIALAVAISGEHNAAKAAGVDYFAWISEDREMKLPWSDTPGTRPDPRRFIDDNGVSQIFGRLLAHAKRTRTDER